jgi:hypothetical protein
LKMDSTETKISIKNPDMPLDFKNPDEKESA